jgi:hypothetical protein
MIVGTFRSFCVTNTFALQNLNQTFLNFGFDLNLSKFIRASLREAAVGGEGGRFARLSGAVHPPEREGRAS